jgi:hypothetical protein
LFLGHFLSFFRLVLHGLAEPYLYSESIATLINQCNNGRVTTQLSKERIEIVPGVTGPAWLTSDAPAVATVKGGLSLRVTIEYYPDLGRYACREISVRADAPSAVIVSEDLRDVPVATWIPALLLITTEPIIQDLPNPDDHEPWGRTPPADVKDYRVARVLPWVAQIYKFAFAVGLRPTKAVEQSLGVGKSTASNWIDKARAAGLLGTTKPGKAGV